MENQSSTSMIGLKWGAISGVVSIAISALGIVFKWNETSAQSPATGILVSIASLIFTILVLFMAIKEFQKDNEGYLSVGQGIGIGTISGAIWGLLSGGFSLIYNQFIDPQAVERQMAAVREQWAAQGMSEEQMAQAESMTSMFTSPGVGFVVTIVTGIVVGLIISLIISAIMKKERPMFE
jgi:hypothetical protein